MNQLKELFTLDTNENGDIAVLGKELHIALGIKTEYKKWINRMLDYGFDENLDYVRVTQKCPTLGGTQNITNHILTIDTAKEISMLQRTEKGKQVRKYFIQVEKDFKIFLETEYSSMKERLSKLESENNELQDRILLLESQKDNESLVDSEKWKEEIVTVLRGIGQKRAYTEKNVPQCTGWTINESYKLLNTKCKTNIKSKVTRYKNRLLGQGKSKVEVDKISIIDFIALDQNLIASYTECVEELSRNYNFRITENKTEINKFTLRLEEKNKNVLTMRERIPNSFGGMEL